MTTTPVRINPRIRERRIEVRREAGRRRLRVLLVVSSLLSVGGLAFLAVTSPLLAVHRIRVAGAEHVTAAQVISASHIHLHDHLLFVDTGTAARRIEQLPWVEHASVTRALPTTVRITIDEYAPAAYVPVAGGVMLVAANGHVITQATVAPPHTVQIRGVVQPPAPGQLLAPPDAAAVVQDLPTGLAQQVGAVDVGGSGLALDLIGGGQIRLGDSSELAAKAASAIAVLTHLDGAHFSYIDVSTPDRPVSHS